MQGILSRLGAQDVRILGAAHISRRGFAWSRDQDWGEYRTQMANRRLYEAQACAEYLQKGWQSEKQEVENLRNRLESEKQALSAILQTCGEMLEKWTPSNGEKEASEERKQFIQRLQDVYVKYQFTKQSSSN